MEQFTEILNIKHDTYTDMCIYNIYQKTLKYNKKKIVFSSKDIHQLTKKKIINY